MFLKPSRLFLKSLSFRLTFGYAALFLFSSFFILSLNYYLFNQSIKDRDHEILFSKAKEYSLIYLKGGVSELEAYLEEQKKSDVDSQFLVRIESADNKTLFLHIPEKLQRLSTADVEEKISHLTYSKDISNFSVLEGSNEDPTEENIYEVATQVSHGGTRIQVARNTDERDDLLERYLKTIVVVSFAVLLIGSFGGFVFSRQALAPLRDLIQTIISVRSGELSARVPVKNSNDELFEISILFNQMAEKIEDLISSMRETLDNVAHDLKTPLTRFKSKGELALLAEPTQANYKEALESAVENTEEIVSLIDSIMDISEAEAGILKLNEVQINSTEVVTEVIDLFQMVAEEKDIQIQFRESAKFEFLGDKNRCKQVLSNLLDNAIKYSPNQSRVEVLCQNAFGVNEIIIKDQGVGIADHEIPKIWNRLYRIDPRPQNRGLGLGLSLVRSICKAQGWSIQVKSELGKGTEFKLIFGLGT